MDLEGSPPLSPSSIDTDDIESVFTASYPPSSETSAGDDVSLRSSIPLSPAPSVYSLTSSLREQSFRLEYGREINSYSEVYRLPADEEEFLRLERQHHMFQQMMGIWPSPLPEVMAPQPGVVKAVLDLGCGSGSWISDVARAFPEGSAVGVDLVPVQTPVPPNCRTEVDDINLGLEHFDNSFDVVHIRLISSGIKDYRLLIDHIANCLRSDGLIILHEFDFAVYRPDKTLHAPWSTLRPVSEASALCRWFYILGNAIADRGGSRDAATHLHRWIQEHPGFPDSEIQYDEFFAPFGPYEYQEEWKDVGCYPKEIGSMMNEDVHSFIRGGRVLLLGNGMHPEDLDRLEDEAHRDLDDLTNPKFVKIQRVYARKRSVL